ncbi:hypothetical protein Vadar_010147 [Vaccinium darrowii]|uniref:Uncharacterized protein n=1 Tax=Vaccinium darrowii TaxID=229202 RepID=A0ACB7YW84_9ERIC|nr:hypothetical protein Vadar_010147 [Vaccinium darrowii]
MGIWLMGYADSDGIVKAGSWHLFTEGSMGSGVRKMAMQVFGMGWDGCLCTSKTYTCINQVYTCREGPPTGTLAANSFQVADVHLEKDYPFSHSKKDSVLRPRVSIEGYACIASGQEAKMLRILSGYHPIVVSMVHSNSLDHYERGIYKPPRYLYGKNIKMIQGEPDFPNDTTFHFMTVVAAGIFHGRNVWLLKNNWGKEWGMTGFIFLPRDRTFADCLGINLHPSFPVVGPPERYELNSNKYVYRDY